MRYDRKERMRYKSHCHLVGELDSQHHKDGWKHWFLTEWPETSVLDWKDQLEAVARISGAVLHLVRS